MVKCFNSNSLLELMAFLTFNKFEIDSLETWKLKAKSGYIGFFSYKSYLSNFKTLNNGECSEKYYMLYKAEYFKDMETAEKIKECDNPVMLKRYGKEVKNFDPVLWSKVSTYYVYVACIKKYTQDPNAYQALISTHPYPLAEMSPYDKIWGTGLKINNPEEMCYNLDFPGQNLLGRVLMLVRSHFI